MIIKTGEGTITAIIDPKNIDKKQAQKVIDKHSDKNSDKKSSKEEDKKLAS